MNQGLIYNASEFQRHLWNDHKLQDHGANIAELEAIKRYAAFGDFAGEMFHYFHAEEPQRLDEPAPGSDVFQRLDDAMRQVPEVDDLRAQTIGNDRWAGIVTSSMIDTILSKVPAPDSQVADTRGDEQAVEYLKRLMEQAKADDDDEQAASIQETLDEIVDDMNAKKASAKSAADDMDPTAMRQAVRVAVKQAQDDIKASQALMDAFGVGTDPGAGRKAQMAVSARLADLVKNNDRLKRIAELAGRLRRIANEEQRRKPRHGCGERVGRRPDNDLARLCFRELVYGAENMRHVFASKYAERSLACIEKADRKTDQKGPVVMVLDSSGSMSSGDADVWAAAVCLAYMDIARQQRRDFAIVHFGADVLRVDKFIGADAMTPEAVVAASGFFAADGGTNFEDSLNAAVDIIDETGSFAKADIVMVTDGCARVSDDWLDKWNARRQDLDFSCYSILVGSYCDCAVNDKFSDKVECLADAIRDEKQMHHLFGKV